MIVNSINGFCMALADSIPGISGGTVAYILGFYDKFLTSLNDILSPNKLKQKNAFFFLVQLLIGWVIGFILSVLVLSTLFTKQIYFMSSFLIGLTLFSIPLICYEERKIFKKEALSIIKYILFFIIGFLIVIYISKPTTSNINETIDLSKINFILGLRLLVAGILAISTMILPGISGSTLLVILKLYIPVISAIKEILTFNFDYLFAIIIFGCGIIIGAVTTVKIVKLALKKFRASTVSLIIGLISAATYSIILGPTSLDIPQKALSFSSFSIIGFLLGGAIILSLHLIKLSKNKKIN